MVNIFGLSKTHKKLEDINFRLRMNAENNYRDATLRDLKELEDNFLALKAVGKINKKQDTYYSSIIEKYKKEFKDFSHRSQIANW